MRDRLKSFRFTGRSIGCVVATMVPHPRRRPHSISRPRLDRASCSLRHQGAGRLPLRAYRAIVDLAPIAAISLFQSYYSARPSWSLHAGPSVANRSRPRRQLDCGRSTTFTVSLEGITDTQAAGITNLARPTAIARASGRNSHNAIVLHVCHEQPAQKANDRQYPSPTRRPSASQPSRTKL